MNTPVVLPVVRIQVDNTGALAVELDGAPYPADRILGRRDLRNLIRTITSELQSAVRVEVTEADGAAYTDIELPAEPHADPPLDGPDAELTSPSASPGIKGTGFRPGEQVALAYVILEQDADEAGNATVHLPPSVLSSSRRGPMLLVGLESCVAALIEATA